MIKEKKHNRKSKVNSPLKKEGVKPGVLRVYLRNKPFTAGKLLKILDETNLSIDTRDQHMAELMHLGIEIASGVVNSGKENQIWVNGFDGETWVSMFLVDRSTSRKE